MSFAEEQLDYGIGYGQVGGPQFNTTVAVFRSGREARNQNWEDMRGRWDLGSRVIDEDEKNYLMNFFCMRRGKWQGFRFKNWLDYQANDELLAQTGAPTVQLIKTYGSGSNKYVKNITKPVSGVTMERGGASFTAFTLDTATGIATLTADSTKTITGITRANPGVITVSGSHGFTTGYEIYLSGIVGMTQLNGQLVTITSTGASTFSIGVDTSTYTAYSSGGTAAKYVQDGETLTWSGTFDTPVRFDTDEFRANFSARMENENDQLYDLDPLPIVEIRV